MKILIIDDDIRAARALLCMLADDEVWIEHDATEGLARAVRACALGSPFDLVLCELGLPDISGLDVLLALRALHDRPVCALMSSYDRLVERPAARDHVLVKPLAHAELDQLADEVYGRTRPAPRPHRVRGTMV